MPEIPCFYQKIRKVPEIFLNLSLNLNLAILKMRIAWPFIITEDNVTHATMPYNPALNNETTDTAAF